jgi:hypothetical protein
MKNIHLPLPDDAYAALQAEAKRQRMPATTMARVAIQNWLTARKKALRRQEIAEYAEAMAGTGADLDRALEQATVDLLLQEQV